MEQNKKVKTYNNAKVYRIVCNETGLQYIGSTCKTLSARLSGHKSVYKRYLNGNNQFITSFKILENDNFDIVLLENLINCKSKDELHQRERYYIDNMECVNKVKKLGISNEMDKQSYNKLYHEENKEKIHIRQRKNRAENIGKYNEISRNYYHNNTQKVKEYFKIKAQEVVNCPCGCTYKGPNHRARHERTKKHIDNMLKLEQN